MREFADADNFVVIVAKSEQDYQALTLRELLPEGFGPENLNI